MARLGDNPGPDFTAGRIPSDAADREPGRWLIYGPTFVVAARAASVDEALALVLVKLGYGDRPWLADNLNARWASPAETAAVCQARRPRRVRPMQVTKPIERAVRRCALALRERDRRADGGRDMTGGAGQGTRAGTRTGAAAKQRPRRALDALDGVKS
jgi:hypothetical protein